MHQLAEHDRPHVGVDELRPRLAGRFELPDALHRELRPVRVILHRVVGDQPAAVEQQMLDGDRVLPVLPEFGDVRRDRRVQVDLPALGQYQDRRRGGHRLGHRGEVEDGVGRHGHRVRLDGAVAVGLEVDHVVAAADEQDGAGTLTRGDGVLDRAVGVLHVREVERLRLARGYRHHQDQAGHVTVHDGRASAPRRTFSSDGGLRVCSSGGEAMRLVVFLLAMMPCAARGAEALRTRHFTVESREDAGARVTVGGVPVIRGSSVQLHAPDWKRGYYSSNSSPRKIEVTDSQRTITVRHAADKHVTFALTETYRIVGDGELEVTLAGQLDSDVPAQLEWAIGYVNAFALYGGGYSSGGGDVTPVVPRGMKNGDKPVVVEGATAVTLKSLVGSVT